MKRFPPYFDIYIKTRKSQYIIFSRALDKNKKSFVSVRDSSFFLLGNTYMKIGRQASREALKLE